MKAIHPFIKSIQEVEKSISELRTLLLNHSNSKLVYSSDEFNEMMGISSATSKKWRKDGDIAYCQLKNKIYYKTVDILEFLDKNYNPIKKKEFIMF